MKHSSLPFSAVAASTALGVLVFSHSAAADHHEGEKVDFAKQIYPILEAKCVECHKQPYDTERGRVKKPKSKLRFDAKKFIIAGGSIQAKALEEGGDPAPTLTPGDASKSTMYTYTTLPEDDDYHMPTKGDDLTPEEQQLLKKWIDDGADFGEWVGNESEEVLPYTPEAE